jgi:class 3 adenylate cyclase
MSNSTFNQRFHGNFANLFTEELLTHSLHFPVSNLILEALKEGGWSYFKEPDAYILVASAISQALALTFLRQRKLSWIFLGYIAGPITYVILEAPIEGVKFFSAPQHIAFWVFSILIGIFGSLSTIKNFRLQNMFLLAENILRTFIPISMYIIFEAHEQNVFQTLPTFFADPAHIFLTLVMVLLGFIFGFTAIQDKSNQERIEKLTEQLKNYSTWSLGENVFNQAISNEDIFNIKRVERTLFFIDIRGFTKWSEKETPENVVHMLNDYYLEAEKILVDFPIIKMKFTADEIMIVFQDVNTAVHAAISLRDQLNTYLQGYNLNAGGGIHCGDVVEGLIGSEKHRLFDVMGDTVNTAKRLCESAKGNEILVSEKIINESEGRAFTKEMREVSLKGKELPQKVFPLISFLK